MQPNELVSLSELKQLVTLSEYDSRQVEEVKTLSAKINYEIGHLRPIVAKPVFILKEGNRLDNSYVMLYHDSIPAYLCIFINYNLLDKKYEISCYNQYEFCNPHQMQQVRKELNLEIPHNIGTMTEKKLLQWVNYIVTLHAGYAQRNDANETKIKQYFTSLFARCYPKEDYNKPHEKEGILYIKADNSRGAIYRNFIEYSFDVDKGNGRVNERIELKAVTNNINTFDCLSNNGFAK